MKVESRREKVVVHAHCARRQYKTCVHNGIRRIRITDNTTFRLTKIVDLQTVLPE